MVHLIFELHVGKFALISTCICLCHSGIMFHYKILFSAICYKVYILQYMYMLQTR